MIRFSRYIWLYVVISTLVLVPGVFGLVRWGLRPSIDFTGGTLLELKLPDGGEERVLYETLEKDNVPVVSVQKTNDQTYLLRIKPDGNEKQALFHEHLATALGTAPEVLRNEQVGPVLGKELLSKALTAAVIAMVMILGYVAYAFRNVRFGVAAIIALGHDLLVVLGSFALLGYFFKVEVDTLFVTAFLTTMSFSVHDTIVVFDRIREHSRRGGARPFAEIVDMALTETMNRSLINSLTIIFMLVALMLLGGQTIRWFVVALLIGTISGTYSSPFVAAPVLLLWNRMTNKSV